jgi:riboflavin synthase
MFTGIVEEVGQVVRVEDLDRARRFRIGASTVLQGLALGDSVSVDGACQTVVTLFPDGFEVVSVASTLSRTTFGGFQAGRKVNLERALALGARLGGHLVQGHVDGVGTVRAVAALGEAVLIDFEVPPEVAAVTVLHGSITLNGISLTINATPAPGVAQVSIVPYTLAHTNIGELGVGDAVNLEGDMIGKYVRHLLGAPGRETGGDAEHLSRAWGY